MNPKLTAESTLKELAATPVGRDIIDKIFLQAGLPQSLLRGFGGLKLGSAAKLAQRFTGPGVLETVLGLVNSHPIRDALPTNAEPQWWKSAVFYQVYPRSFADSNGDGIGDLQGIIGKLDYLSDLGIDCLWLSPIFASPNKDMGYDISDYRAIMPEMGQLADLDGLIAGCHQRGMRIILDLVVNHTSDEHDWFKQAVADPDGKFADYYHFVPGSPDSPPNNWRSFFSGPAWRWVPEANRWVLHLFTPEQLDLRWDNPAVRSEVAEIVQWWLSRGIDGFRLDVINYISKAPGLPEGHPFVGELLEFTGVEHYFYGPKLHEYLSELRSAGFTRNGPPSSTPRARRAGLPLGDPAPPDPVAVMVGETPGIGVELGRQLTGCSPTALDLTFNFDVLDTPGHTRWDDYRYDPEYLKRYYKQYWERLGEGDWLSIFFDNHDNPRMLSKWAAGSERDPAIRTAIAKVLATIQLTMKGTPFPFQGQELGAVNQQFSDLSQLRDVESINRHSEQIAAGRGPHATWAEILSGTRDHARVPMRWTADGGFSTTTAWLTGTDHAAGFSADAQQLDPDSVWSYYRDLINLRRAHPSLLQGKLIWLHPRRKHYFAYERALGAERIRIECNTSAKPLRPPKNPGLPQPLMGSQSALLPAWGSRISLIQPAAG